MALLSYIHTIRAALEKGRLKVAFQQMKDLFQAMEEQALEDPNIEHLHKNFLLLSGEFHFNAEREQLFLAEEAFTDQNRNRILKALNGITDELEVIIRQAEAPISGTQQPKGGKWVWWISLVVLVLGAAGFLLINSLWNSETKSKKSFLPGYKLLLEPSIFQPNDSTHFNVLILRFEDYIALAEAPCIGRSIQEHLNVAQANKDLALPLRTYYADTIPPPNSLEQAQRIQQQHHADLIIYGLTRNIQEGCAGADICFRYNIAPKVVAKVTPALDVKTYKHDSEFQQADPISIEKGVLKIDALSMDHWISSLIKVKANKVDEAFLELDRIASDTTLNDEEIAERFLVIGNTFKDLGQFRKGIIAYNQCLVYKPNNILALYNRGLAFFKLKEYQKAISDLSKAIEIQPDYADAFIDRGIAYSFLEEYQIAISDFSKAIEIQPDMALVFNIRGIIYSFLEEYQIAISDFSKAIKIQPDLANAFYNRGETYYDLENYQQAISDFSKAIELQPDYADAFFKRGNSYSNLQENQKAINDYSNAIELQPDYTNAFFKRGNAYYDLEDYQKAINDYSNAIEIQPNLASAFNNRGYAYYDLEDYRKAINDYSKAIELQPDYTDAFFQRGNSYSNLEEYQKAINDYSKAIELQPDYTNAFFNRGIAYSDLEDYQKAISDYSKAIELEPDYTNAFHNRGNSYSNLEDYQKAINDYTKAIEIQPNYADGLFMRGKAYSELKRYDIALQDFWSCILIQPSDFGAYFSILYLIFFEQYWYLSLPLLLLLLLRKPIRKILSRMNRL